MGELGHLIGLLTQCTQSIVATWLIFTNWCWKLRLTWDSFMPMYLNFLLNPWSKASPTLITNPYTCWTMCSHCCHIDKHSLVFIPGSWCIIPLRSRYLVQGTSRHIMFKPSFHLITSEQQDPVFRGSGHDEKTVRCKRWFSSAFPRPAAET